MIEFNLNEGIYVKLTALGYQLLADRHNSFIGRIKNWEYRTADYYRSKANPEGYTRFQAWDFMAKFGPVTQLAGPQYFDTNILIDVKTNAATA